MTRQACALVLLASLWAATACDTEADTPPAAIDAKELKQRADHLAKALRKYSDESDRPVARWLLPDRLKEVSGLALTADGRLLTHGNNQARVFEIDYRHGVLIKQFSVGLDDKAVKGDFEGITVASNTIYLLESDGKLYEFHEGADGTSVPYTVHDTGLKSECEFEGVAFAKAINSLLLSCKNVFDKSRKDSLVIYRWKLAPDSGPRLSRLTVPLERVIGTNGWKSLHPSDITVEPFHGNYVLIASAEQALIEITPQGEPVLARPLPGRHLQPEGVAITPDSLLLISDEAGHRTPDETVHRAAAITLYRWP
jgi:uncharacterized protein YjiK